MSPRITQYFAIAIFVVAFGFSGCRAGHGRPALFPQSQGNVGQSMFGGGQMTRRVGNIAINRAINAGITAMVRGL